MSIYRRKVVHLHRNYSDNNGKREAKKPKTNSVLTLLMVK
jgi:hypothetical protein